MDTTAIGITIGLTIAFIYASFRGIRERNFNLQQTILVFLAAFSIPGGIQLISAALLDNQNILPTSWREYVAVAGITVVGLAFHYLVEAFRISWHRQYKSSSKDSIKAHSQNSYSKLDVN